MTRAGPHQRLQDYRDRHAGGSVIVCGCGRSLNDLPVDYPGITIGVNDVGRRLDPTYLVVLNPRGQFQGDRFRYVAESRAQALFTQLELGVGHPRIVRFRLGERGGTDLGRDDALPYTRNSAYVALCLAIYMGARRIGLIGVDFTEHHFFGPTGTHPLSAELERIDREFAALAAAARARGVRIVNLSAQSRITAFEKGALEDFTAGAVGQARDPAPRPGPSARVFFVDYRFQTCGDVFATGLRHAAKTLGVVHDGAAWDDAALPRKIAAFAPDLLFVVHGRRYVQRWRGRIDHPNSALWLLDEPYEVDDAARYSARFRTVFVNDYATLDRHHNAHYLPVAYDPQLHFDPGTEREHDVGFIGGSNPTRERMLCALLEAGRLSYVVGGPWQSPGLRALTISGTLAPAAVARLYKRTKLVINVFRDRHHYNRAGLIARSLNPRVYEALACGAVVLSEAREELGRLFPALPVFRDARELVGQAEALVGDASARAAVLAACAPALAEHDYARRLARALEVCMGEREPRPMAQTQVIEPTPPPPTGLPPAYAILMVVRDACEIVKLSTLRTLRHSAGESARLVVVDNASTDGARQWLEMLAARGDIELIRAERNLGHGPGLELARASSRSEYLVTLDSDAFPLRDGWLGDLRARLDARVLATGILHHRDYVHPACMMLRRATLEAHGLDFLDEKDRPSRLDVAERISVTLKEQGYAIDGLARSGEQRRGSRSEPVYLGSQYEGLVYHQWYTTRSVLAGGGQVDDVPREAIARSLEELLQSGRAEPRDIAVVIGARAAEAEPERLRNLRVVLEAVNLQRLARWRYRVVLVEQDREPRLREALGPLVDDYLFAYNPGPYNRGWAFNVGARAVGESVRALCLLDADLWVPADFLARGLARFEAGARALQPYTEVLYLDEASTAGLLAEPSEARERASDALAGALFTNAHGGCLWVTPALYGQLGGHDERFEGWGYEDREFFARLSRHATVERLEGRLLHLHHRPSGQQAPEVLANARLLQRTLRARSSRPARGAYGDPGRYRPPPPPAQPRRDWEHWEAWSEARIEAILEERAVHGAGPRKRLVDLAATLGRSVLDVGCGPGSLWRHAAAYAPFVQWAGIDVTARMLRVARRHFPQVALCQGDVAALPYASQAFDVVVMRHLMEHLPAELAAAALAESLRVARRAVVLGFYLPPRDLRASVRGRVGEGFIETQWASAELEGLIAAADGRLVHRCTSHRRGRELEELWFLAPPGAPTVQALGPEPLVSIVMPFYRRLHTVGRAVASVLAQRYPHWELIVVDNEGTEKLAFDDPRIRILRHTERASASYARNHGLGAARGELVCFFDDDDEMCPDYLATFIETFRADARARLVRVGMRATNGRADYSYATPECCLRRVDASPTWADEDYEQDQHYFERIVSARGWTAERGEIVTVRKVLCQAHTDPAGGLRAGAL